MPAQGAATAQPVARVRECLDRGQFAQAQQHAQALLASSPEDRDGLYMLAVALRFQGRLAEALETLERLEARHPQYSRLYQERGHCHVL